MVFQAHFLSAGPKGVYICALPDGQGHVSPQDVFVPLLPYVSQSYDLNVWPDTTPEPDHEFAPFAVAHKMFALTVLPGATGPVSASDIPDTTAIELLPVHAAIDKDPALPETVETQLIKTWWAVAGDASLHFDSLRLSMHRTIGTDGITIAVVPQEPGPGSRQVWADATIGLFAVAGVSLAAYLYMRRS